MGIIGRLANAAYVRPNEGVCCFSYDIKKPPFLFGEQENKNYFALMDKKNYGIVTIEVGSP
jgi:hypothetical protein